MNVHTVRRAPRTSPDAPAWGSARVKAGWVVLLVVSVGGALNHLLGAVTFAEAGEEQLMFVLFGGVNAYAAAVLLSPYRRLQRWAWGATWIEVAAFAAAAPLVGGGTGTGYLVVAAVAAIAQLATFRAFWR